MNSYERVRAAVSHQTPDRVPCDFSAEKVVLESLYDYFGLHTLEELLTVLEIDRRPVGPAYVGPALRAFEDGSYETIVSGGPRYKDVPLDETSMTSAIVHFPWADVETADDLAGRYGWNGHISWWDFSVIPQQIDALEAQGRYWITTHGDPSGLQHLCMWVGDEKFLMTLATDEDLAVAMIEKHNEYRLEHALRSLEAGGGRIHELGGGGDYGSQNGLLISKAMFRRYFKLLYLKFYQTIKKHFDVEIFFHSCGSIAELIPELIEVGVTILDPIQTSARHMEIEKLKQRYGNRLTFHGALDVQKLLPYASEAEVRQAVRRAISVLGAQGGYILAPSHALQPDTPLENILALYEEAQGRKLRPARPVFLR
jgi:uroporphyrinogen decarboxylase